MNVYVINVITTTKNKELYEKVAVNEYPLVIKCSNVERLKEILSERQNYIKNVLKTETLYNHGEYFVREIILNGMDYDINEYKFLVRDITFVKYNEL